LYERIFTKETCRGQVQNSFTGFYPVSYNLDQMETQDWWKINGLQMIQADLDVAATFGNSLGGPTCVGANLNGGAANAVPASLFGLVKIFVGELDKLGRVFHGR
jgi:hypothetical protein